MKPFLKFLLPCLLFSGRTGYAEQTTSIPVQEGTEITVAAPAPPEMKSSENQSPSAGLIQTGETSIQNPETGEWKTAHSYGPPPKSQSDLYMDGDYVWMSFITVCLIAMLFAAWKAPRWVKEIGLAALVLGMIYFMIGLYCISDFIGQGGALDLPTEKLIPILFSGFRVALIAPYTD